MLDAAAGRVKALYISSRFLATCFLDVWL